MADVDSGYGGFNISIDPFFSPMFLTFIQIHRGVIAVPSIRGGNEFGEDWHLGGSLKNKVWIYFLVLLHTPGH
jgi:prolyl oligopeptidase